MDTTQQPSAGRIVGDWLWEQTEAGVLTAAEVDQYIAAGSQAGSNAPLLKLLESLTEPGRPRARQASVAPPEIDEVFEVLRRTPRRGMAATRMVQQFYRRWWAEREEEARETLGHVRTAD